jgi:hypothetical protein
MLKRDHPKGSARASHTHPDKLYEEESGLEPLLEGCVQHVTLNHYGAEIYVTAFGVDPATKTRLSYAIASERYGPVIVLSAAAPSVQLLVAEVGPVGGVKRFPDYRAGSGDFYLLRSPRGTYVLIRRSGSNEYSMLAPTVARAWLGAIKEHDQWLWPASPRGDVIELDADEPAPNVVDRIVTNATTGEATRSGYRYPASPVRELSATELESLAAKA